LIAKCVRDQVAHQVSAQAWTLRLGFRSPGDSTSDNECSDHGSKTCTPTESEAEMLILAEGTIHRPVLDDQRPATQAWLGPMVDGGFLQSGYADMPGNRLWMFLSSPDLKDANQRLQDLPVVQDGSVSFTRPR
jgi:hypothetical protein